MNKLLKNKKALSPVVAAVAVIAVMVAVAVGAALLMGSVATSTMGDNKLTVTGMDFTTGDSSSGRITIHITNSLDHAVTISGMRINNQLAGVWSSTSNTIASGDSETFTVTQAVLPGNQYNVNIYDTEGTLIAAYTDTA
jgi:hypothetical protein